MSSGRTRKVFAVTSAGRVLRVSADSRFPGWWPRLAPHVPGAIPAGLAVASAGTAPDLILDDGVSPGDARRLINAALHRLHAVGGTVCAHAVTLTRPDDGGAVVLLGGHGAGKTLVAIALAEQGWRLVAGDVSLVGVHPVPVVHGGTSAVIARRAAVARWFPGLYPDAPRADRIDLPRIDLRDRWTNRPASGGEDGNRGGEGGGEGGRVCGAEGGIGSTGGRIVASVLVDVDGDPRAHTGDLGVADDHTARTAWLRASTHLLDRVLETSDTVLRLLEDTAAARQRVALVDALASRLPLHTAWGSPQHIARQVTTLTDQETRPQPRSRPEPGMGTRRGAVL